MLRIVGLLCVVLAAGDAAALSCIVPNFGRDFNYAQASEARFYVALGRLIPDGPVPDVLPEEQASQTGVRGYSVPYRFVGSLIGKAGPGPEREMAVRVEVNCVAVWCGGFPRGTDAALMLLEQDGDGAIFRIGACGAAQLVEPDASDLRAIGACLRQGACRRGQLDHFERRFR